MLSHLSLLPLVAMGTALNTALLSDGKKHNVGLLSFTFQAHIPTPTQVQVQDCREMQSLIVGNYFTVES